MEIQMTAPLEIITPEWLAHRYDPINDAVHFVEAPRSERQLAPFLTDEYLSRSSTPVVVSRKDALQRVSGNQKLHYIFHSAYCCSTLLANSLGQEGVASTIKEPTILNDLVGWRHRGGEPRKIGEVLDDALTLLARPFSLNEPSIVKPSNVVNGLAEAMLQIRPDSAAILLFAPLRPFLASIASKGMWGRMWVRELLSRQLTDGLIDLGFEPRDYIQLTDLQVAAVGWLAQQQLFAKLTERHSHRIRTLDSELLVQRPVETIAACARLFGISLNNERSAAIAAEVFAKNAKDGSPFAADRRETNRLSATAVHAEEIDKVAIWAEAVASSAGVALELNNSLLDTF
jgi:hypothetical protein